MPARPGGRRPDPGADPLAEYRAKRDPARTAEPVPPAGQPLPTGGDDTFVVQEHRTPRGRTGERVHWDLRLERDGVLKSWAVPKGPPLEAGSNRLAVPTEDHPLEYASFAGTIAAGEYGGGEVTIWDAGRYATEKWDERHVIVTFAGRRLTGRYALFPLADGTWNVRKLDAGPPPEAPPAPLPMLASAGELPTAAEDGGWAYEFKWDGVRAVATVRSGVPTLSSRKGTDITVRYPEVTRLPAALAGHDVVVDGEIVMMDAAGRPDFGALQNRMHRTGPEVPRMAAAAPVTYLVFDLLELDGEDLRSRPYAARRELLDELAPAGRRWVLTPWFRGGGADVQAASEENGLEGVVAKRLTSPYREGVRSPDWRKVKNFFTQAVVVGGWRPGQGRRSGTIGSLLVGVPDDDGALVYVGHVGTGFSDQDLRDLQRTLTARTTPPFAGALPREVTRDAHWVEPDLVGEVAYAVWTADGRLRHPAWRGVRDDLEPDDVVQEP
ncbi:non-homologous end-joining DNA ligase [Blastococcus sp. VKM Ac-2987]|uniref:non-homologous end-joining DNA ligase n=1 Tax=Blastococcus sp. VKM Ac-2987 TaxID=3004141 RepID=UPI0022ABB357|nr:non-homologous end-joining DNA ligase [Blastococcus sp. VKM Ac-2987]MCZ2860351.1 non-homologous end-joining DNA ligase [Blastococcus sp. VKM Ac-2987]